MKNTLFKITLILVAIATVFGVFSASHTALADSIISWGVSPNTKGLTPEVPKGSAEMLGQNNGLFVGDTGQKNVYFTFDLGYEAGHTAAVLDILKDNNIKAIFFLCGNYLKEEQLVNRMINEGHEIGNHTERHKDLPTLTDVQITDDIMNFDCQFKEKYGQTPVRFFRPPQGRFDERVLKIASQNNLKTTLWSIAIVDWAKTPIPAKPNADKIASRLHNGAIILSHITNAGTVEMLKILIPQIKEKGFTIDCPANL